MLVMLDLKVPKQVYELFNDIVAKSVLFKVMNKPIS